mgnify:CR=1 FL=1
MKVNKNMVSGNSAMLVLKLLSEKDMYGYEMIDALAKRSNNIFEFKSRCFCIQCCMEWYSRDIWNLIIRKLTESYVNIIALQSMEKISGKNDRRMECV